MVVLWVSKKPGDPICFYIIGSQGLYGINTGRAFTRLDWFMAKTEGLIYLHLEEDLQNIDCSIVFVFYLFS